MAAISATPAASATLGGSTPTHTALHTEIRTNLNTANTWTGAIAALTLELTGTTLTLADSCNIVVNATTGTKIGTATSQKIGFFNAAPVVQQVATTDLGVALSNLGLRAAGTAYTITTSGAVALTGTVTITDVNVVLGTATGTQFGTGATQKIGFFGQTPRVQCTAYTQTFATADKTHASRTAVAHTYPGSGNMFDAVAADLLINVRTDSTANAVADIVVNEKSLADNLNQTIVDLADTAGVVNALVDDLQALGLVA